MCRTCPWQLLVLDTLRFGSCARFLWLEKLFSTDKFLHRQPKLRGMRPLMHVVAARVYYDPAFLPRDAMLARYEPWPRVYVCLSVCPCMCQFACHKSEFYRNWWKDRADFGTWASVLLRVIRKFGYIQNKGTSLWNFVPNSGLNKFRHGKSIVLSTKLIYDRTCWPVRTVDVSRLHAQ